MAAIPAATPTERSSPSVRIEPSVCGSAPLDAGSRRKSRLTAKRPTTAVVS